jgi:hypothetical protein
MSYRNYDEGEDDNLNDSSFLLHDERLNHSRLSASSSLNFQPIVGTINRSDQMRLKKLVYRTSRGIAYIQFFDL